MEAGNCSAVPPSSTNQSTISCAITATTESPTSKLANMRSSPGHQSSADAPELLPNSSSCSPSLPAPSSPTAAVPPLNHRDTASAVDGSDEGGAAESQAESQPEAPADKSQEESEKTPNITPSKTTTEQSPNNSNNAVGCNKTNPPVEKDSSSKLSKDSVKDNPTENISNVVSPKLTNNNKTALESLQESPSPLLAGSSSKPHQARRYSSTTASPERPAGTGYRKLSIQPRTTQYEPHPLLQATNEQGGSLLDDFFADRQMFHNPDLKLQPRCAQYEKGGLLERTASGLTELEIYLQEREKEIVRNPMTKASSVDSTSSASSRRAMLLRQQSMPERPRLEPRVLQFEQHALLAEKDNSGRSILDAFLAEKEQDLEGSDNSSITSKGKCSEKCTCKNANCPVCKGPTSKSSFSTASVSSSSGSHPPLIKKESSRETVIEPKANNKRVHFSESGEDDERPADDTEGDKPPSPSKQNSTDNNVSSMGAEYNKSRTGENKCKAKAKRKCVIS